MTFQPLRCSSTRRQKLEPMNPAPPVTRSVRVETAIVESGTAPSTSAEHLLPSLDPLRVVDARSRRGLSTHVVRPAFGHVITGTNQTLERAGIGPPAVERGVRQ